MNETSPGADRLAIRASMYTKASPPAPVLFSWTGFYVGLNVGGKWAHTEGHVAADTLDSIGLAGTNGGTVIGGGQIGYNWQPPGSPWVFGIEAEVDAQDWSTTRTFGVRSVFFLPGDTFTVESHWQASVRGRIGYAWDRTLLYATGGVAFTQVKAGTLLVPAPGLMQASSTSDDQTVAGGTVGGGIEYAFTNNVSVGAEGRWTFYGGNDLSGGARAHSLVTQHIKLDSAEAKGTLNFRF